MRAGRRRSGRRLAVFASGIFASTDELRPVAQAMLDASVDRLLDKPAFREALLRKR